MLYRFAIPIPNYYGDDVFNQHLYVESDHSPTQEELVKVLTELDVRDKAYDEYVGDWRKCIDSINTFGEDDKSRTWPRLGGRLIETNTFVQVPALKDNQTHSLSLKIIRPLKLGDNDTVQSYV